MRQRRALRPCLFALRTKFVQAGEAFFYAGGELLRNTPARVLSLGLALAVLAVEAQAAPKPKADAETALGSARAADRLTAAEEIRAKKTVVPSRKLRDSFASEERPYLRARLLQALAAQDESAVLPLAIETLQGDLDPQVRRMAAEETGRLAAEPTAQAALIQALAGDPSSDVRLVCAVALSRLENATVFQALETAAAQDPDAHVRRQIAYGLKHHASPRAAALRNVLRRDRDAAVRETAR